MLVVTILASCLLKNKLILLTLAKTPFNWGVLKRVDPVKCSSAIRQAAEADEPRQAGFDGVDFI